MIHFAKRLESVGEYYFSKKLEQIAQMNQLSSAEAVINLGIGNPDGTPSDITIQTAIDALQKPQNHGYQSYRGTPTLRLAMAQWYNQEFQLNLEANQNILPLLGSKEGIMYVSMALLNPGDQVLIPNPGYPAYHNVAQLLGAQSIHYDLKAENNWYPDLNALQSLDFSKIKLMWINYPHMPTGQVADAELFRKLVKLAREKNFLLVNDNPYSHVLNPNPMSLLQFDKKMDIVAELNSMSKAFNMAGWRVGLLAGSERLIQAVLQVKSNVDTGMFLPLQLAAAKAYSNSALWHDERNRIYSLRRDVAAEIFKTLGFSISNEQVGMFVWAKAPATIASVPDFVESILQEARVFLVPGEVFGSNGQRFARASLCQPLEVLQEALKRVQRWVDQR